MTRLIMAPGTAHAQLVDIFYHIRTRREGGPEGVHLGLPFWGREVVGAASNGTV